VPFNVGKVGQVAASRHPILVDDVAAQNDWIERPEWAKREEIRSFAGHPLIFRDKLLGVIAVFSRQRLSQQEFTWLGLFANQAAVAIANACTEEALRSSERNLTAIINTIPTAAWTTRPDGYCDFLNQVWLDYAGMTAEQAQGWGWAEAIHPDDRTKLVEEWQLCLASGTRVDTEARIRRFDGSYHWFLIRGNPLRDESGNILKWYGTCIDIDDRKRAEEKLRAAEFSSRQTVDSIPGHVTRTSAAGEVEFANRQFLAYFGNNFEDIKNWATSGIVHHEDLPRAIEISNNSFSGGDPYELEARIRRFDGAYRWFRVRGCPLRDAEGRILHWYVLSTDIDDQKKAEEALNRARSELAHVTRVTTLNALTASIAHEVNQPLSGIVSNAGATLRFLSGDAPNLEEVREAIRDIVRDGKRAGEIITRIRALTKRTATRREKLDLNETISEVLALIGDEAKRNKVIVRTQFDDTLSPVAGDRVQLQQVVLNLVMNAIEAMRSVSERPRELVITTQNIDAECVQATVEDSGIGIGSDTVDKIFDSFYTTKPGGMGMGLSISRSILQSHGGRLWAVGKDAPGTMFHFTVPKYREEGAHAPAAGT
jgi:PAS domain S-box-containing protein